MSAYLWRALAPLTDSSTPDATPAWAVAKHTAQVNDPTTAPLCPPRPPDAHAPGRGFDDTTRAIGDVAPRVNLSHTRPDRPHARDRLRATARVRPTPQVNLMSLYHDARLIPPGDDTAGGASDELLKLEFYDDEGLPDDDDDTGGAPPAFFATPHGSNGASSRGGGSPTGALLRSPRFVGIASFNS